MKNSKLIQKRFFPILFFLFSLLFFTACTGPSEEEKTTDIVGTSSPTIAQIGSAELSAEDLSSYLVERPVYGNVEQFQTALRSRLDELITAEVLAQEAQRLHIDQEPQIKQTIRQILAQKLLDEKVVKPVLNREISEDELKKYYQEQLREFSRPAMIRLADIYFAIAKNASSKEKNNKKILAEQVLKEAKESQNERFSFSGLIKKYSDKHPSYLLGDTGFFDDTGGATVDTVFAEAAFTLQKIGDIADRVIETSYGFHVVMLTGRKPAMEKKFITVKTEIEQRIRRRELTARRLHFINKIKNDADIKIENEEFNLLLEELGEKNQGEEQGSKQTAPPALPQY